MQNENTTAQIIDIVAKITQEMMTTQSNSNNDLKLLLLIIYNECFCDGGELDPLLKSYLTVALHRFITIENSNQEIVTPTPVPQPVVEATNFNNESFMTTKLNEEIIKQLIHTRAPQLGELM